MLLQYDAKYSNHAQNLAVRCVPRRDTAQPQIKTQIYKMIRTYDPIIWLEK